MQMNPFTAVLVAANMDPPPDESSRVTHLLKGMLQLGESLYRGPNRHSNPAVEVRSILRQAGVSPMITEGAFFDSMEKRLG